MKLLGTLIFALIAHNSFAQKRPLRCDACALINVDSTKSTDRIVDALVDKGFTLKLILNGTLSELYACQDEHPDYQSFYITSRNGFSPLSQFDWSLTSDRTAHKQFEYIKSINRSDAKNAKWFLNTITPLPNCQAWISGEVEYSPRKFPWD